MAANADWNSPSILRLRRYQDADATVLSCTGRITVDTAPQLKAEAHDIIGRSPRLVLDLSCVNYMDSSGLGAIVGLYVSARRAHCELQVMNLTRQVYHLFQITRVLGIFESCGKYLTHMP